MAKKTSVPAQKPITPKQTPKTPQPDTYKRGTTKPGGGPTRK